MDLVKLKAHIDSDPDVRGYVGMTDEEVSIDLHVPDRHTRIRNSMSRNEVIEAVVPAEYSALSDAKKAEFWGLIGVDNIDPSGNSALVVQDIFGASTTVTNLNTARQESVNDAEYYELGDVTPGDVTQARAL